MKPYFAQSKRVLTERTGPDHHPPAGLHGVPIPAWPASVPLEIDELPWSVTIASDDGVPVELVDRTVPGRMATIDGWVWGFVVTIRHSTRSKASAGRTVFRVVAMRWRGDLIGTSVVGWGNWDPMLIWSFDRRPHARDFYDQLDTTLDVYLAEILL